MKKLAILIYPEFSMQEIGDLMFIFRWFYDVKTVMVSTSKDTVVSEEGIQVLPELTTDEFHKDDFYCLALSGCSDFRIPLRDEKITQFLREFKDDNFVVGAICAGPVFLSKAGLLDGKKFTNSLFVEANEMLRFIQHENRLNEPLVIDGNIITAAGDSYRMFAVAMARAAGFDCREEAMKEKEHWEEKDFVHHLSEEDAQEFAKEFSEYI